MSLYNMLFGRNSQTALLLAVIGLRENDVERLRDVFASEDGAEIHVYTRTGGGNREDYPNLALRKARGWTESHDDDFDCTYCTDYFSVPVKYQADVAALRDVLAHGMRKAFARHLAKTLRREPTESDKAASACDAERIELQRLPHLMANGHTFVPLSDYAMEAALKIAEANDGELRTCWGILPINLRIVRDERQSPNAKDKAVAARLTRAEIGYDYRWSMDVPYWEHCQELFASSYPKTMAKIAQSVERHLTRETGVQA